MKNLIKGFAVTGLVVGLVTPQLSMAQRVDPKYRKENMRIAKDGAGCHHGNYKRKKPPHKKESKHKDSFGSEEKEEHVITKEVDGKKTEKVVSKADYEAFEKMPDGTQSEKDAKSAFFDKAKEQK